MSFAAEAGRLDAADPLSAWRARFVEPEEPGFIAYLDGNSLGRPPAELPRVITEFIRGSWGSRLIRGWTDQPESWMDWPTIVGDELAAACLGAASGQTVIADSTSVLIYKLARAALSLRSPGRTEVVLDADNFPTDRYLLEGIAAELDLSLRWIETDPELGVTPDQVDAVVGEQTALFLASHVSYRSGYVAEAKAITALAHDRGVPVLWDLSHSVGSVPIALDDWGADFAVGCGYKYLNGGPGAPAFGYVAARHQEHARQPIQGWMGHAQPFDMGPGYQPHQGMRAFITGTPPILAMVPLRLGVSMIAEAGLPQIRQKSLALTDFALRVIDADLVSLGVHVGSPRDHDHRGGHLTIIRSGFETVNDRLWARGVIPDFRRPDGIRLGLSPLSTSFAEVQRALGIVVEEMPGC